MGIIILVIFWVAVIFSISTLGSRTALIFAGLWLIGLVIDVVLHIGGFYFIAYEAILSVILCFKLKSEWS